MRFIREIFTPALKCRRLGHRKHKEARRIYRKPDSYTSRAVCEEWIQTRTVCRRCGKELSRWADKKKLGYFTGVTWPSEMMDHFKEHGWVESAHY